MKVSSKEGTVYQTNGIIMKEDGTPRTRAKWDEAFEELLKNELIFDVNYKGQIFVLTNNGYKIVDEIKDDH